MCTCVYVHVSWTYACVCRNEKERGERFDTFLLMMNATDGEMPTGSSICNMLFHTCLGIF